MSKRWTPRSVKRRLRSLRNAMFDKSEGLRVATGCQESGASAAVQTLDAVGDYIGQLERQIFEHANQIGVQASTVLETNRGMIALRDALTKIADPSNASDPCGCEHDSKDCCAFHETDYHCPLCIAWQALHAIDCTSTTDTKGQSDAD